MSVLTGVRIEATQLGLLAGELAPVLTGGDLVALNRTGSSWEEHACFGSTARGPFHVDRQ